MNKQTGWQNVADQGCDSLIVATAADGENRDQAIDQDELLVLKLGERIVQRGLITPALIFLEMHRSLGSIFHSAILVTQPMLVLLFGPELVKTAIRLLGSNQSIERLISHLRTVAEGA